MHTVYIVALVLGGLALGGLVGKIMGRKVNPDERKGRTVRWALIGAFLAFAVWPLFGGTFSGDDAYDELRFEQEVIASDQPVLVDFYANWCGPCVRLMPVIDSLREQFEGRAKVVKINVDHSKSLFRKYGNPRGSIPTITLWSGGREVRRWVGGREREVFEQAIEEALAQAAPAKDDPKETIP